MLSSRINVIGWWLLQLLLGCSKGEPEAGGLVLGQSLRAHGSDDIDIMVLALLRD